MGMKLGLKKPSRRVMCLVLGVLLLLAGLQLRVVETYVLSPGATRVAAKYFGADPYTARGTVETIALATSNPRKALTPPRWLGWAMLAGGFVAVAYGVTSGKR